MEAGKACVNGEWCWGRKKWKKKREGKNGALAIAMCGSWGRKKWRKKWKRIKMGVDKCESSEEGEEQRRKNGEGKKMGGRLVMGGRVSMLRGERKKKGRRMEVWVRSSSCQVLKKGRKWRAKWKEMRVGRKKRNKIKKGK